jgi:tripartite-type tricarboxylate transporter receptor subunit TctC
MGVYPFFFASGFATSRAHSMKAVDTIQEFIAYARARPGQLNYGSSGVGSVHHISMEGFKSALKLDIAHVPFKGTGESVPALLGGHVDVLFSAYPSLSGAAESKIIKLLASNGADRSSQAPDLPAISEIIPRFNFAFRRKWAIASRLLQCSNTRATPFPCNRAR